MDDMAAPQSQRMVSTRLSILLVLASLLVVACASLRDIPSTSSSEMFEDFVAAAERHIVGETTDGSPGVSVVFFRHDRTLLSGGYGYADRGRRTPATRETLFQVASISKTLTGYGVMKLAEAGTVDLNGAVEEQLSSFELPASDWDASEATVRRLLSHTAGLSLGGYPGFSPARDLPTTAESLRGDTGRFWMFPVGDVEIERRPGDSFHYSGGGYTVLQLLIEDVSGEPFADYMDSQILRPLGLRSSTFDPKRVEVARYARPYSRFGRELPQYVFAAKAAAGLHATADELALVLKDLLRGYLGAPDQFLDTESYQRMLTPVAQVDESVSIGLSFFLRTLADGSVYAHHSGANRGWKCHFGVNLQSGEGMVILTNSDRAVAEIIAPIVRAYEEYRNRS